MKHFHITTRTSSSSTLLDIRVYITWPTVNGCSNRQTMENDCVPTRCPVLSPLIHSICQFTRRHWSSSGASSSSSNDDRRPITNFAHPRLGPAPAAISNWTSLRREPSSSHPPAMVLTSASDCNEDALLDSTFASRYLQSSLPKFKMPEASIPKEAAYQVISDELMLDGNPRLNLASFVTTWMEDECNKIIMDSINKNFVDMDEYPITTEIQNRCVNMIARLFHAPLDGGDEQQAIGCATVGSSEAIMLAGLAFKRKWQNKRKAEGKPFDKPNIVTGANVQVCWEKFARYFEVELKEVKLREGYYVMDPVKAVDMVDENTICVCAILGSTYNGEFEDVKTLNRLLEEKNSRTGWNTPIHVDAASGGFVAPFIYPELEWDFKLSLVRSINVSGHKYGLVYAGVGWAIWKSQADLPEDLIFHINYLGSDQPTFTLNFSKGSSQIIAQYYQFLRLGFHGYKQIIANCAQNAKTLTECLQKTGQFNILSKPVGVPVVAFSLNKNSNYGYDEYMISDHLRRFGWIVPAYTMAPDAQHVSLLRVVVREEFSKTLCDRLVRDILFVLQDLDHLHHPQLPVPGKTLPETAPAEAEVEMEAVHDRGDVVVDDSAAPSMVDAFKHFGRARVALRLLRGKASDKTKAVC